jgi:hypothetical protein
VDTTALRERFGEALQYSTAETLREHARQRRVRDIVRSQHEYQYEEELETFLRSGRLAQSNGHAAAARPARRAPSRRRAHLTGTEQ